MVTLTEEQNKTIGRLLRHHHSTVYRVRPHVAGSKKIGVVVVGIHCGGRDWFECNVSTSGVAYSIGGGMGNVVALGVQAA